MHIPGALNVSTRGDREIVITRTFNAPRRLVFDAFTKPELLKRWFHGPDGWTLAMCEFDARPGGKYRYVWQGSDGESMGMGGVIREIDPPARMVGTEVFDEPWYPGEAYGTFEFVEQGGKTLFTLTVTYASREARDGVLKSGFEKGVGPSYDRLEQLVIGMAAA
jgi:uncharacterized protein YndB with AHSA1/START domain